MSLEKGWILRPKPNAYPRKDNQVPKRKNQVFHALEKTSKALDKIPTPPEFKFKNFFDFVVQMGRPYDYAPLPSRFQKMTPKQCFFNATILALKKKLIYVEGYAMFENIGITIQHAWCVMPKSNIVIDPTTDSFRYYYGVPFKRNYIATKYSQKRDSTSMIDDWTNGHPLLRMTKEQLRKSVIRN